MRLVGPLLLVAALLIGGYSQSPQPAPRPFEEVKERHIYFAGGCYDIRLRPSRKFKSKTEENFKEYEKWIGGKIKLNAIRAGEMISVIEICLETPEAAYPGYENDILSLIE